MGLDPVQADFFFFFFSGFKFTTVQVVSITGMINRGAGIAQW